MKKSRRASRSRWGSVYRRGRTYYVKFRWPKGGRRYTRAIGPDKETAENRLLAIEASLKNGAPLRDVLAELCNEVPPSSLTFRQIIDRYLQYARRKLTPKSVTSRLPHFKSIKTASWASLPLQDVTRLDIQSWLDQLQVKRGLRGSTVNRYAASVSAVFRWAGRNDLCPATLNPARNLEKHHESSGRENYLTTKELQAWVDAAPDYFRPLALFYARTGVRRDEARLLRWRAIDFARRTVRIEAEQSKNRRAREIELVSDAWAALRDLRSQIVIKRGSLPDGDEFVFSHSGKPWSTNRLYDAFRATVAACAGSIPEPKLQRLVLHDIRHTFGAILATDGVSLEIIAKVMGHKSLVTTQRYAHLMPTVISHVASVIEASIPRPDADRVSEAVA